MGFFSSYLTLEQQNSTLDRTLISCDIQPEKNNTMFCQHNIASKASAMILMIVLLFFFAWGGSFFFLTLVDRTVDITHPCLSNSVSFGFFQMKLLEAI